MLAGHMSLDGDQLGNKSCIDLSPDLSSALVVSTRFDLDRKRQFIYEIKSQNVFFRVDSQISRRDRVAEKKARKNYTSTNNRTTYNTFFFAQAVQLWFV